MLQQQMRAHACACMGRDPARVLSRGFEQHSQEDDDEEEQWERVMMPRDIQVYTLARPPFTQGY